MVPEGNVLITKFPFHSSLSGVEKHTFQIVENLNSAGMRFFLLSSCPVMLAEFKKRGWQCQRWWLGLAPVNFGAQMLFAVAFPFLIISALVGLIYFKIKFRTNKLYCLTLAEKLVMTPLARILGYRVFWLEHLSASPVITDNPLLFLYKWWSRLAQIIAVSDFVKRELDEVGVKNVMVIRHGIDIEKYKKQQDIYGAMAKQRRGNNQKIFRVGAVCRLEKIKGLEYLIKAIDLLKDEIPEIDLVLVGEGTQRRHLEWLIEALNLENKVKLVGYKDNFLDWIYDFDVFVLASLKESLGIILMEALACGKPVISTAVGGVPEIIENEKQGLLVDPADPAALAAAILRLYKDKALAECLAAAGREVVARDFTLAKMLEEYGGILL